MRQITKMLSLGSAVAYLLSGCGQGNCPTAPNADNPSSTSLNLTMSAPAEYPAGIPVTMPVVVTNNNPYTLTNINYTIVDDNATSGQITIDPTSATNCATIAANQPCTLSVVIPATSKPGAFSIKAISIISTTISTTGLTQVPVNNATGVNGVAMYYQPYITLPNNNSGIALVTFVVNSANVGVFNTIDLVDSNGNSLQYQVLTGNSGNGMTALSQGSVVTLAVSIPSGATQLSFFPSLKYNGTPIANGLASSPTTINVLRPDAPAQGILNVVPSNFSLNESNPSQIITVTNSGDGVASNLRPSVAAPIQIDLGLSTCGTTLESNSVCTYVVKFDGQSDKSGTSAFTLYYNTGIQQLSGSAAFTYQGAMVGMWTWMSGESTINQAGVYGTLGVASPSNIPGARWRSISWTDESGNFWLFGGYGYNNSGSSGRLNDLWRYNPNNQEWTWISGTNITDALGIYGNQGVASPSNIPGARVDSISWIDKSGNLWLFGGQGNGDSSLPWLQGMLNDLWCYNPTINQWTWIGGSTIAYQQGFYGDKGIPSTNNTPGARSGSISWTDKVGNLWLFGGSGNDNSGLLGMLNDLWLYNPKTNQWTWMSGESTINEIGNYGTLGIESLSNIPSARNYSISWTDTSDNLWLFGGNAVDNNQNLSSFNDLWRYNPKNGQWTWMSGESTPYGAGNYGTLGVESSTNIPGARSNSISWTDKVGNLWLFGGTVRGQNLNDLWRYNTTTNQWTWMSGESTGDSLGNYGIKGQSSANNMPGSRYSSISWIDNVGNLWLFGGNGYDGTSLGSLNDLWMYTTPY